MMRGGGLRLRPDSSPAKIHWAVHRALKTLGMDSSKEGVHTLRRSAARARFDQLVSEGYDGALRQVQTLLHHANAKTTEVYLGIDIDVQARDDAIRGKRLFSSFDTKHLRAVQ
jgi:integrase